MKKNNIIYMTDKGAPILDNFPELLLEYPIGCKDLMRIGINKLKTFTDQKFIAFCSHPGTFKIDQKTLQYVGERMTSIGIEHQKSVKEKSISTKSQVLSTNKNN